MKSVIAALLVLGSMVAMNARAQMAQVPQGDFSYAGNDDASPLSIDADGSVKYGIPGQRSMMKGTLEFTESRYLNGASKLSNIYTMSFPRQSLACQYAISKLRGGNYDLKALNNDASCPPGGFIENANSDSSSDAAAIYSQHRHYQEAPEVSASPEEPGASY